MTCKWTPERVAEFSQMWTDGATVKSIQQHFRVSQQTADRLRVRLGFASRMPNFWTPEREAEAKRLYIVEGLSAEETARRIGAASRNAIIGIANRRGWMAEGRKPAARPTARPIKAPRVRPVVTNKPPKPGPHNRPGEVFGKTISRETDPVKVEAARTERRIVGGSAEERVNSGAGVESPNARPFMEAAKGCKWPIGSGLSMLYCCNPKRTEGGPYCSGHHAVSISDFQPVLRPRDAARRTRFDRVERERPTAPAFDRTLWDDARLEAA